MSGDVVARAKAALEGTTPAPWVVNDEGWAVISHESDSVLHPYVETECVECDAEIVQSMGCKVALSIEDLEFIVAARSLVPELVAEVERSQAQLELRRNACGRLAFTAADLHAERDTLRAEVEKLRGALETIFGIYKDEELGAPAKLADISGVAMGALGLLRTEP